MNIHEKLMTVQQKLKAPKSQRNDFGKYNYRSCEDILESVKPLLAEVKAVLTIRDDIEMVGDRFYIRAIARLMDTETENSYIESYAYAREDLDKKGMDLAQITGSVSSYARKYALNGLFCIDDTKDSDATNKHGKEEQEPPKKIDTTKVKVVTDLLKKTNSDVPAFLKYYKITKIEDMTVDTFTKAVTTLKSKLKS